MSILLGIYLAGLFTTTGYGWGMCANSSGHAPTGGCYIVTTIAAPAWPVLVPMAIYEDGKK